jgi:hypothetical protein
MSFNPFILETIATYTSPPICTSAPDSQTALIWRTVGAANDQRNTLWARRDNPLIRHVRVSHPRRGRNAIAQLESKFLNQRVESVALVGVTKLATIEKILHKIFTFVLLTATFQNAWRCYVDK